MGFICVLSQDAQLNKAEQVISTPEEETTTGPSSSSTEAAGDTTTPEVQTTEQQPTDTQSGAPSIISPIDLSTKRSPVPEWNIRTATAAATSAKSTGMLMMRSHPDFINFLLKHCTCLPPMNRPNHTLGVSGLQWVNASDCIKCLSGLPFISFTMVRDAFHKLFTILRLTFRPFILTE